VPGLVVDERVKSAVPTMETAACAEPVRMTAAARMVEEVFFMVFKVLGSWFLVLC